MSYTMADLIGDVLPRIGRNEKQSGITLYQAASSVQSLIYKTLLKRKSDLIASGELDLVIPAMGCSADLPTDFMAMAEKPEAEDIYTDWMAGTVVSYNPVTGALVVNVTQYSGSDTLASWNIASAALPGLPSENIGTSTTSLTVGSGSKSLTATLGMSLNAGDYVLIVTTDLPSNLTYPRRHHINPSYLDDDEHSEYRWWEWYMMYGQFFEPALLKPNKYKIIGTTMFIRPKVIVSIKIVGKYFAKVSPFSLPTDVIPWNGFFDEVFRAGVMRILSKGMEIPDVDQDFVAFIEREVHSVVDSRITLIPNTRRLKRGSYL
jgi:hypothetical protein